jgi:hypothetical protein
MRHFLLFICGAAVIYAGFFVASFTGPVFAFYIQPLLSALLSGLAIVAAMLVGLLTRGRAASRVWHNTPLGVSLALLALVLGWIAIVAAFTASQRATISNAILGVCVVYAALPRWISVFSTGPPGRPNQSLEPTAGRPDAQF